MSTEPQSNGLRLISGGDTVGDDGDVLITRSADGLQMSVDGQAPEPVGGGVVASVVGGAGIIVDDSDPTSPEVSASSDYDGWLKAQIATMLLAAPALTQFRELPLSLFANGTPAANWTAANGGTAGASLSAANGKAAAFSNLSIVPLPASTSWAFAVRGSLATSTAGRFNFFGLIDAAIQNTYGVNTYSTVDGTHYILYTATGATEEAAISSLVCDDGTHDFVVGLDATAEDPLLSLYVDGALVASNIDLSGLSDGAVTYLGLFNTISPQTIAMRAAVGFIAP